MDERNLKPTTKPHNPNYRIKKTDTKWHLLARHCRVGLESLSEKSKF